MRTKKPGTDRYEPDIDQARIWEMREALESDRELSQALRLEISRALSHLNNFILLEELRWKRMGDPKTFVTHWAAMLAGATVTKRGVSKKAAVRVGIAALRAAFAALGHDDAKAEANVNKEYTKLKLWESSVWAVNERVLEEAATHLSVAEIADGKKRLARRQTRRKI